MAKKKKQKKKNTPSKQPVVSRPKEFLDLIAPAAVKFNTDHFILGGTYRSVVALRSYPPTTEELALLRRLGEMAGVTLRLSARRVTTAEEDAIIHAATNKNRMERSNFSNIKQSVTAEEKIQDVETLIKTTRRQTEPLIHCSCFLELTAPTMEELRSLRDEVNAILIRSKLGTDPLLLRQRDGFLSSNPAGQNAFGSFAERVLPASSVANLYPISYSGKTDPMGFYVGRDKYGSNVIVDLDRRADDKTNASALILGNSGQGKTYGQNAFFYDAAEGLLTAVVLLLAEYLPPTKEDSSERRHIVSVFKLVQDLLESPGPRQKNYFQQLMGKLPDNHKAKWFAGAALNTSDQAMASVMSTVLSRLNAFLDSELEQVICFDSAIDAETFASEKCAIFLILPEEDTTKNFMAGLMIQNLSRELFAVADENGGKLKNRVVLFCDELGTMPPFDILPLFSAGRSRRLTLVPIIQSLAQLEKNYGKEGSEIIQDNCQDTIFGGFAPGSQTAEVLSKNLGTRTVQSGSVSQSKNDPSQSLQMVERPLMTPDELRSIPKGHFVVMKTGCHPMQTRLRLFLEWGITFEKEGYTVPARENAQVHYAGRKELEDSILCRSMKNAESKKADGAPPQNGGQGMTEADDHVHPSDDSSLRT